MSFGGVEEDSFCSVVVVSIIERLYFGEIMDVRPDFVTLSTERNLGFENVCCTGDLRALAGVV